MHCEEEKPQIMEVTVLSREREEGRRTGGEETAGGEMTGAWERAGRTREGLGWK